MGVELMRTIIAALVVLLVVSASAEAFLWPWQQHRRSRSHRHHQTVETGGPDCGQIRAAVEALEPSRLERALRESNAKQRQTIARCRVER